MLSRLSNEVTSYVENTFVEWDAIGYASSVSVTSDLLRSMFAHLLPAQDVPREGNLQTYRKPISRLSRIPVLRELMARDSPAFREDTETDPLPRKRSFYSIG